MGLRKFRCYRNIVRAFTRKSRYRKKAYISSIPAHRIVKFDMGDVQGNYSYVLYMKSKDACQIRHNAIESARQVCNRHLTDKLGAQGYRFQINMYPHHLLRENKILSGAGADRLSSGMKNSFGKTIGSAAQIKRGKTLFTVFVSSSAGVAAAQEALSRAGPRLPCRVHIDLVKLPA